METDAWNRLRKAAIRFEVETGFQISLSANDQKGERFSYKSDPKTSSGSRPMRGVRQPMREDVQIAMSLPQWNREAYQKRDERLHGNQDNDEDELNLDPDDLDFEDYSNQDENDLELEDVDQPTNMPVSIKISQPRRNSSGDNIACSAPVVIGTPSRDRIQQEEFVGAESYWGSQLHKYHLSQKQQ